MIATLNHDEEMPQENPQAPVIHNIIYGADGWTDEFDDHTLHILLKAGVVRHETSHSGTNWVTNIFVSNEGKV